MKSRVMILGLALIAANLAVWAVSMVNGQPNLQPPPEPVPATPVSTYHPVRPPPPATLPPGVAVPAQMPVGSPYAQPAPLIGTHLPTPPMVQPTMPGQVPMPPQVISSQVVVPQVPEPPPPGSDNPTGTPRVDLAVHGPGLRYLDRRAVYQFKVTNPGTAVASQVTLVDQVPQGFKFVSATAEGRHDFVSRTVYWVLGDIAPGESKEVSLELIAVNPGEHKNKAVATAARGIKAEGEAVTRVEGLPALLMELVDLDDPVEVGTETSYEIRVTNTGTKTETNLVLTCTVPDKMEFKGAKGAGGLSFKAEGTDIVFEPLPKLAPRADAIYRINVKGSAPGDLRFRARIKADGLEEAVLKEESTKVYGDEHQGGTLLELSFAAGDHRNGLASRRIDYADLVLRSGRRLDIGDRLDGPAVRLVGDRGGLADRAGLPHHRDGMRRRGPGNAP